MKLNLNKQEAVTLLYAAQNKEHNDAIVLKTYLESEKRKKYLTENVREIKDFITFASP